MAAGPSARVAVDIGGTCTDLVSLREVATAELEDDEITFDVTGTHPQVPGPVNCTTTSLHSGVRTIVKAITSPDIPVNEGCRPVKIVCPPRTIFTAERPAPVSTYWETVPPADQVVEDVRDGYVKVEAAERVYDVVVDAITLNFLGQSQERRRRWEGSGKRS